MPASDVTISVESQTLTRITDYTIATTLITGYTGSETEVVMPSSYYPYQQETGNTLRFENMGEFTSYIEQTGGANIAGGHFTYKTADSQDYSDVVKDAMAWMGEAMTYTEDQFPLLIINLPTEYSISLEDQKTLSEDSLFYGIIGPFTSLGVNTILSFTVQIGNDEPVDINVSGGSILDDIMAGEESEVFNMLPIAFSNIEYGNTIACVGEGVNLSTISAAFSNNTNITQVTIPEGFTTIDYSAFENCTNLSSVSIPSSITYIDDSAFNNCTSLNYNENNNRQHFKSLFGFSGCD